MKKIKFTIPVLCTLVFGATMSQNSLAETKTADSNIERFQVKNNQVTPLFKKLFLTQEDRQRIDKQREAYLHPPAKVPEKVIAKIEPKAKGNGKPKKKRIYIPPKVAISAVIIKPDGSTIIRVNGKYNKPPSKYIQLDERQTNTDGVPITVNGKTKIVPVGTTLLTHRNKLIDTYKLDAQARKNALPKTEQKAVKNRLDQVKILNAEPTDLKPIK